jgi:hypothetical protein
MRSLRRAFPTALLALFGCVHADRPIPFIPTQNQVAIFVELNAATLTFLLDTAVTPSIIDLARAESLGVAVERNSEVEGSGTGSGKSSVFPARVRSLQVGSVQVTDLEIMAADLSGLGAKLGQRLDGILGESFLRGRVIGVDYRAGSVHVFKNSRQAQAWTSTCRMRYLEPMQFVPGDVAPLLKVRVAGVEVPVSLDTGSALELELYDGALAAPGLSSVLGARRPRIVTGARGESHVTDAILDGAVKLGPFEWTHPTVTLSGPKGSPETRLGNFGNQLLRGKRLLLNYHDRQLGLFDDCMST